MATKNLARTVVEGGRSGYSKLHGTLRNRRRRRLRFGVDGEVRCSKVRPASGREFADRLAPLKRWLARHVGRGWSNVYREFCERFDRRSMKGWHLEAHLLQGGPRPFPVGSVLLRRRSVLRERWQRSVSPTEKARALTWAAGRRVIVYGDAAFWTARTIDPLVPTSPQGRPLTPDELNFWASLPLELRETLTYNAEEGRRRRAILGELQDSKR